MKVLLAVLLAATIFEIVAGQGCKGGVDGYNCQTGVWVPRMEYDIFGRKCWFYHSKHEEQELDWFEAEKQCQKLGVNQGHEAHLASILSIQENAFIWQMGDNNRHPRWIGLHAEKFNYIPGAGKNNYSRAVLLPQFRTWSDGLPFHNTILDEVTGAILDAPWFPNEPNNRKMLNETCVSQGYRCHNVNAKCLTAPDRWNDATCTGARYHKGFTRPFVCKYCVGSTATSTPTTSFTTTSTNTFTSTLTSTKTTDNTCLPTNPCVPQGVAQTTAVGLRDFNQVMFNALVFTCSKHPVVSHSCSCSKGFGDAQATAVSTNAQGDCQTLYNLCEAPFPLYNLSRPNNGLCVHGDCSMVAPNVSSCHDAFGKCSNAHWKGQYCEVDVDECVEAYPCSDKGTCTNTIGGYTCQCNPGWKTDPVNATGCVDVDECTAISPPSDVNTCGPLTNNSCTNMNAPNLGRTLANPGYTCVCNTGYESTNPSQPNAPCTDINECLLINNCGCTSSDNNPAHFICNNNVPGCSCSCPVGWQFAPSSTTHCVDVDECASNPCQNGGTCSQGLGTNQYSCTCAFGFGRVPGGDSGNCEVAFGFCVSNGLEVCTGGACKSIDGVGYSCNCNFDNIISNTNGQTLDGTLGHYTGRRLSGQTLTTIIDPTCTLGALFNNDPSLVCSTIGATKGYLNVPVGGSCLVQVNECTAPGFTTSCETNSSRGSCSDLASLYNITTQVSSNFFQCVCQPGYKLAADKFTCDNINECLDITTHVCHFEGIATSNNSLCFDTDGSYYCGCPAGYELVGGNTCRNINECLLVATNNCDPVVGGCTDKIPGYTCNCSIGSTLNADGYTCDDVNECNSNPCQNGGTCTNGPGTKNNLYTCACVPGYGLSQITGADVSPPSGNCQVKYEKCQAPFPRYTANGLTNNGLCVNGTCFGSVNDYSCTCFFNSVGSPGWNGKNCDNNINECATSNGGCAQICTDSPGDFSCSCYPGWKKDGTYGCIDIDECLISLPGPDKHTCTSNNSCVNQNAPVTGRDSSNPGYTCKCNVGYEKINQTNVISPCQDINECLLPQKCGCVGDTLFGGLPVNSVDCINLPGSANPGGNCSCSCAPGFAVNNSVAPGYCQNILECSSNPCKFFSTCIDSVNGFVCVCSPGYGGTLCDVPDYNCGTDPSLGSQFFSINPKVVGVDKASFVLRKSDGCCYGRLGVRKPWDEARLMCARLGGVLPPMITYDDWVFLARYLIDHSAGEATWLGGRRSGNAYLWNPLPENITNKFNPKANFSDPTSASLNVENTYAPWPQYSPDAGSYQNTIAHPTAHLPSELVCLQAGFSVTILPVNGVQKVCNVDCPRNISFDLKQFCQPTNKFCLAGASPIDGSCSAYPSSGESCGFIPYVVEVSPSQNFTVNGSPGPVNKFIPSRFLKGNVGAAVNTGGNFSAPFLPWVQLVDGDCDQGTSNPGVFCKVCRFSSTLFANANPTRTLAQFAAMGDSGWKDFRY